jgi:formylglycine-generating enzyme required for sulfatase activity
MFRGSNTGFEWVSVPGGKYLMGSDGDELNRNDDEIQHLVTVLPFKISKYPITVHQFNEFIESTSYITDSERGSYVWRGYACKFKPWASWKCNERGGTLGVNNFDHPVVHISWNDAKAYTEWKGCRLPTEAEWEYACRAGTLTPFNSGQALKMQRANFKPDNAYNGVRNSDFNNKIMPVGKLSPNAWGLYDMHGNINEWCNDFYASYPIVPQTNPVGPLSGEYHVVRGGSWLSSMRSCRSACRNYYKPDETLYDTGFRVVLSE